jgi:hypothetical protein
MAPLLYSWLARMYNELVRSSTQGDISFRTYSASAQRGMEHEQTCEYLNSVFCRAYQPINKRAILCFLGVTLHADRILVMHGMLLVGKLAFGVFQRLTP